MKLVRIVKLDKRYKLYKKLNHTVCIDMYFHWAFHNWITQAERYLQETLGDQAELDYRTTGKWTGEYQQFEKHCYGYRISLEEEKYLDLLLLKVGFPEQSKNSLFVNMLEATEGFKA